MMGTRLSSLVSSLESQGVPLQLNQRDVSMAQRGPLLVSTLQEVARERRKFYSIDTEYDLGKLG
jgi:hypothetical protein